MWTAIMSKCIKGTHPSKSMKNENLDWIFPMASHQIPPKSNEIKYSHLSSQCQPHAKRNGCPLNKSCLVGLCPQAIVKAIFVCAACNIQLVQRAKFLSTLYPLFAIHRSIILVKHSCLKSQHHLILLITPGVCQFNNLTNELNIVQSLVFCKRGL